MARRLYVLYWEPEDGSNAVSVVGPVEGDEARESAEEKSGVPLEEWEETPGENEKRIEGKGGEWVLRGPMLG